MRDLYNAVMMAETKEMKEAELDILNDHCKMNTFGMLNIDLWFGMFQA
jgi:hypothetical protein